VCLVPPKAKGKSKRGAWVWSLLSFVRRVPLAIGRVAWVGSPLAFVRRVPLAVGRVAGLVCPGLVSPAGLRCARAGSNPRGAWMPTPVHSATRVGSGPGFWPGFLCRGLATCLRWVDRSCCGLEPSHTLPTRPARGVRGAKPRRPGAWGLGPQKAQTTNPQRSRASGEQEMRMRRPPGRRGGRLRPGGLNPAGGWGDQPGARLTRLRLSILGE